MDKVINEEWLRLQKNIRNWIELFKSNPALKWCILDISLSSLHWSNAAWLLSSLGLKPDKILADQNATQVVLLPYGEALVTNRWVSLVLQSTMPFQESVPGYVFAPMLELKQAVETYLEKQDVVMHAAVNQIKVCAQAKQVKVFAFGIDTNKVGNLKFASQPEAKIVNLNLDREQMCELLVQLGIKNNWQQKVAVPEGVYNFSDARVCEAQVPSIPGVKVYAVDWIESWSMLGGACVGGMDYVIAVNCELMFCRD